MKKAHSLYRLFLVYERKPNPATGKTGLYRVFECMRAERPELVYRCRNGMMAIISMRPYCRGQIVNPRKLLKEIHSPLQVSPHL